MARSVSLAAYMALARRAPGADWKPPTGERPEGDLIWAHAARQNRVAALLQVAERMLLHRDVTMVLTGADDATAPRRLPPNVIWADVPGENATEIKAFLKHYRPDVCLWSGGDLRPALVTLAGQTGLPIYLVDAEEAAFDEARWRWLPDMSRAVLSPITQVFALSANAGRRLQRLGVPSNRIEVTGPMQESGTALPCSESLRAEMASSFAGRPVWLAAMVRPDELPAVIEAQRLAARSAHRLLLILVPDNVEDAPAFADQIKQAGLSMVTWSDGDMPGEGTQVLLADTRGEMGLWYRLAPITLMASSLVDGQGGHDPFEPAALGSAVLYGPYPGHHLDAYKRLATAGAARIVRDGAGLAAAVIRLTAPDQAATMARAAWEVATNGAEATDRLLDVLNEALDQGAAD